jgi:hypothetical protein
LRDARSFHYTQAFRFPAFGLLRDHSLKQDRPAFGLLKDNFALGNSIPSICDLG